MVFTGVACRNPFYTALSEALRLVSMYTLSALTPMLQTPWVTPHVQCLFCLFSVGAEGTVFPKSIETPNVRADPFKELR